MFLAHIYSILILNQHLIWIISVRTFNRIFFIYIDLLFLIVILDVLVKLIPVSIHFILMLKQSIFLLYYWFKWIFIIVLAVWAIILQFFQIYLLHLRLLIIIIILDIIEFNCACFALFIWVLLIYIILILWMYIILLVSILMVKVHFYDILNSKNLFIGNLNW